MDLARRLKPAHLRLILLTGELGQLQAAAHAMGLSQPAASRILADLEAQVGAKLFERLPKGMEPSPVGAAFVRHARVILSEIDNLAAEVQNLNYGQAGEVRVGAVTGPVVGCLMPALQAVREKAPGLEATVEVGPSTQLVRGLIEGRFDFVLARMPAEYDSRDFHIAPARTEEVTLLVRRGHPLEGRAAVTLAELGEYEWVMQERGSPIRRAIEAAYHDAGVPAPGRIINSSSLLVMLSMLEVSQAIAPQSREVAGLLTRPAIGTNLVPLSVASDLTVSPFFVIRNRASQLSRAAERVMQEVLQRL